MPKSPATGTAPKKHQSITKANPTWDPEGNVPTLGQLSIHRTQLLCNQADKPKTIYAIDTKTSTTRSTPRKHSYPQSEAQSRFRGGTTWRWSDTPPPLPQIASDLRFAIRITNRNRNQIARFGALSHKVFSLCAFSCPNRDPHHPIKGR